MTTPWQTACSQAGLAGWPVGAPFRGRLLARIRQAKAGNSALAAEKVLRRAVEQVLRARPGRDWSQAHDAFREHARLGMHFVTGYDGDHPPISSLPASLQPPYARESQRALVETVILLFREGAKQPREGAEVAPGNEACGRCAQEYGDAVLASGLRRAARSDVLDSHWTLIAAFLSARLCSSEARWRDGGPADAVDLRDDSGGVPPRPSLRPGLHGAQPAGEARLIATERVLDVRVREAEAEQVEEQQQEQPLRILPAQPRRPPSAAVASVETAALLLLSP
jgi:hypothetical protein